MFSSVFKIILILKYKVNLNYLKKKEDRTKVSERNEN